jgi:hypothetical protein
MTLTTGNATLVSTSKSVIGNSKIGVARHGEIYEFVIIRVNLTSSLKIRPL